MEWREALVNYSCALAGSLLNHFHEKAVDERETVSGLKVYVVLAERAGLITNNLTATQKFMEVNQREKQRVMDYFIIIIIIIIIYFILFYFIYFFKYYYYYNNNNNNNNNESNQIL